MATSFKKLLLGGVLICTMLVGVAFTAPTDLFIYFVGYIDDPDAAAIDDLARKYAISFSNSGSNATGISITLEADFTGFQLSGSTPAPDSIVTGTSVVRSGLSLADQATGTYTFILTHPAEGAYTLTASIASETFTEIDSGDNTAAFTRDVLPYPASPTLFTGTVSGSTASLERTNPNDPDFVSVMIRRSAVSYPASTGDGTLVSGSVVDTGFLDSGLADGTYYYAIFSRDASGYYSELPLTGSVTIDTTGPMVPTAFTVTASGNSALLAWTNPVSDFDSVMIRRSTSSYPSSVTDGSLVIGDITTTSYTDSGLTNGTYYYALFAKDAYDNYSIPTTGSVTIAVSVPRTSGGKASSIKRIVKSSSDDDDDDEDDNDNDRDNDDDRDEDDDTDDTTKDTDDEDLLDMLMEDLREGVEETTDSSDLQCSDDEYNAAYEFGFMYGLTTMPSCSEANMDGTLLRKHAAKMISSYALTVLGKEPETNRACVFSDMDTEDEEMKKYATLACQLGLMGLGADGITPLATFNPNRAVDKAQFATMLSRLLYGNTYNGNTSCRYCDHVAALQKEGIITVTSDLTIPLRRAYALIMLMRTKE